LLNAPTGAGKSTWLPLQILADGHIDGRIILLEPRRWPRATWRSGWRNCWARNRGDRRLPDARRNLRRTEYAPGGGD
jgi:hypothetical protein